MAKVRARQRELENEEFDSDADDDFDIQPLTFKQFMGPIIMLLAYFVFSSFVFLIEKIVYYCNSRRNQRNIDLHLQLNEN